MNTEFTLKKIKTVFMSSDLPKNTLTQALLIGKKTQRLRKEVKTFKLIHPNQGTK